MWPLNLTELGYNNSLLAILYVVIVHISVTSKLKIFS
jgi:hypothetical protein